jgi:hypothetical protein
MSSFSLDMFLYAKLSYVIYCKGNSFSGGYKIDSPRVKLSENLVDFRWKTNMIRILLLWEYFPYLSIVQK